MTTTNPLTTLSRLTFGAPDEAALEEGVRAVVTPTFTFRQEGHRTDVDGFLAHLRELRGAMSSGEITMLDELVDRSTRPARVAARATARMRTADGSLAEGESQMIGVLDGDRLDVLHEMGRYLHDGDDRPEPTRTA